MVFHKEIWKPLLFNVIIDLINDFIWENQFYNQEDTGQMLGFEN